MTSTRIGTKSDALLDRAMAYGHAYARFDFRGHGDSDGDVATLTMTNLIADAMAVVEHMGRCVLVGSSMGGLAAAWCAAHGPEAVAALVLLSPAFGYLPEMARQAAAGYELRRSDEQPIELGPEVLRDAQRYGEDALPGLLPMPVLLVHGSHDHTVPLERSEAFCRAIDHADKELWSIEGGSHSLNEDIEAILDRVVVFLSERELLSP